MKKWALVPAILVLLSFLQAHARVYFISSSDDTTNVTSLRGAIIDANKRGGINTIMLQPTGPSIAASVVLHLTRTGADEDAARSGDLDITKGRLSIIGPPAGLTIDATGLGDRVFQVFPRAGLSLHNVNLMGGTAPGNIYATIRDAESGGGIWNAGSLSLINCVIIGNSSGGGNEPLGNGGGTASGNGGGIYNSGQLVLQNCWLVQNSAGAGMDGAPGGNGGGLHNEGFCVLSHCVVEGNQSGAGGGPAGNAWGGGGSGGNGGGIFNSDTMTLLYCSVSNNFAGAGASGGQPSGTFTIGYIPGGWGGAGGSGAGIYNNENSGTLSLTKCSVINNSAGDGGAGGPGVGLDSAGNAGFGGDGAGIFNASSLTLRNCIVSGNACGNGGAGGACTLGNGADGGLAGSGGGIFTGGSFVAVNSTISWNFTGAGGAGGNCQSPGSTTNTPGNGAAGGAGGGIFNKGAAHLSGSTICSNSCQDGGAVGIGPVSLFVLVTGGDGGSGGGICSAKSLNLANCTISGNICGNSGAGTGGSGGGIFNNGFLRQTSCTITENAFGVGSTNETPGGAHTNVQYGSGGGLFNVTNAASAIVRNSIIAGNQPLFTLKVPKPGGGAGITNHNFDVDVSGSFTSQGFNLVGYADPDYEPSFLNGRKSDQVGSGDALVDPLLGPLQMNGGTTPTHALLPGSPAIDRGKSFDLHTDQRGKPRPQDFSSVPDPSGGDGSDIGAFEL